MNTKRLLSLLLSLAMLLMTCMPMPAFAEGEIVEEVAVEEIVEQQVEETEEPVVEETEEPVVEETEEPVVEEIGRASCRERV